MNLHVHLHLKECFLDYGPLHAFWAFPFEHFNGLLESYFTNKKAIEEQIMRKFCQEQLCMIFPHSIIKIYYYYYQ